MPLGYLDSFSRILLNSIYEDASSIKTTDDYSVVQNHKKDGLINSYLELVIPIQYNSLKILNNGLLIASKVMDGEKRYRYLNYYGKTIIPFNFTYATELKNGKATVRLPSDEKYHQIDETGNILD